MLTYFRKLIEQRRETERLAWEDWGRDTRARSPADKRFFFWMFQVFPVVMLGAIPFLYFVL